MQPCVKDEIKVRGRENILCIMIHNVKLIHRSQLVRLCGFFLFCLISHRIILKFLQNDISNDLSLPEVNFYVFDGYKQQISCEMNIN